MKVQVKGAKLLRMMNIIAQQNDRQDFVTQLKTSYASATAIIVRDMPGLCLEYKPYWGAQSRNAFRVPKKLIEDFNAQLVEDNPNVDLDSLATLKLQLNHWVERSATGGAAPLTENDVVEIISVNGQPEAPRMVYRVGVNALLDPNVVFRQRRLTNARIGMVTKFGTNVLTITSVNPADIITQILTAIQNPTIPADPTDEDYDAPYLFAEDIELPSVHFKDGRSYIANIRPTAFDYWGSLEFKIRLEEEDEETTPTLDPLYTTVYQGVENTEHKLVYTGGDLSAAGQPSDHGFIAIKPFANDEQVQFIVPEIIPPHQTIRFSLKPEEQIDAPSNSAYLRIQASEDGIVIVNASNVSQALTAGDTLTLTRVGATLTANTPGGNGITSDAVAGATAEELLQIHVQSSNASEPLVASMQIKPVEQA